MMKYFGDNHKAGRKFHFLINFSLHIASRDQAKKTNGWPRSTAWLSKWRWDLASPQKVLIAFPTLLPYQGLL